jgi:hypothetical protein
VLEPLDLRPGWQEFELRYYASGMRRGQADVVLNSELRLRKVDLSPTMLRIPTCGMSIGISRRLSVSERYAHRGEFQYGGHIDRVRIEPGALAPGSILEPSEEVVQAKIRADASRLQQ